MTDNVDQTAQPSSMVSQLRTAEHHWAWKAGARVLMCLFDIVAIGCAATLVNSARGFDGSPYGYADFSDSSVGALVVFVVSFVWCLTCVVLPMLLKPRRRLHPGIAVGVDLILWLAFIAVALISLAYLYSIVRYGSNSTYLSNLDYGDANGTYGGNYYLAPNNTWVYNITDVYPRFQGNPHYNSTTGTYDYDTPDLSTVVRSCDPPFASCQEQDAFVNRLWHLRTRNAALAIVVNAGEWLGVLFHFALFVWACVDTQRHNRAKSISEATVVAEKVIADLERRGLITVQNGIVVPAPVTQHEPSVQTSEMVQTHPSSRSYYAPGQPQIGEERAVGAPGNDAIAVAR